MGRQNEQKLFSQVLSLTGKEVEVGIASSGEVLQGQVVNAMFDSFILDSSSGRRIVRYQDVKFLTGA